MLTLFFRAILVYFLVFAVLRLSGKRQLSQLQPFDLVITLLIADLASQPVSDPTMPLSHGIVPILALFLVQKLIAFCALKSEHIRTFACGKPLVIIGNGHVQEEIMRKACYSMQDLLEHLRTVSIFNISDVQYAILETSGDLSVLQKSDYQPVTCSDLKISNPPPVLSYALIIDGNIIDRAMKDAQVDEKLLIKQLKEVGIDSVQQVFYAVLGAENMLTIQTKAVFGGRIYSVEAHLGKKNENP